MPAQRRILVTGGAGYVGAVLVPKLLDQGYHVRVLDLYIYGEQVFDAYKANGHLEQIRGDIRDANLLKSSLQGCDSVIHLACISNDPSCDLDPSLSKSINHDAFIPLLKLCKELAIGRFVFASSSSVYGVSDAPRVTEDHPKVPITDYNRYKAMCEDMLAEEDYRRMPWVVIRPATVCGFSPRLRLDLTVNILTNHAFNRGRITVFGGSQYRPNIHIEDITDLYVQLMEEPESRFAGKVFNAGYQNRSVGEIAEIVKEIVESEYPEKVPLPVEVTESDDIRSYVISSEKIGLELQFYPKRTIEDAVRELCTGFASGRIPDPLSDSRYYNITTMKKIGLV